MTQENNSLSSLDFILRFELNNEIEFNLDKLYRMSDGHLVNEKELFIRKILDNISYNLHQLFNDNNTIYPDENYDIKSLKINSIDCTSLRSDVDFENNNNNDK